MARVTGIGGIFFKARDPDGLRGWYRRHLGLDIQEWGGVTFRVPSAPDGSEAITVWNIFPSDSNYFAPGSAEFMINYRVDNLADMLAALRNQGCIVDEKIDDRSSASSAGPRIRRATDSSCGNRRPASSRAKAH
jgi:hypothetical protein